MQVILMERIPKLGQMGDVVEVKPGFARNYLLPQGKALSASKENISKFERQKAQLEATNLETKKEAEQIASRLTGQVFIVLRSASEAGSLYGSVTSRDVVEAALEKGFQIDRKQVVMAKPIKELGIHDLETKLHPEVNAKISLNVARSKEEAELQASGKTIKELAVEKEAEADFEISELFDDLGAAAKEEMIDTDLDLNEESDSDNETSSAENKDSS